jgi:hypothetical protein
MHKAKHSLWRSTWPALALRPPIQKYPGIGLTKATCVCNALVSLREKFRRAEATSPRVSCTVCGLTGGWSV